jgi:hypothetical protein
MCAFLCFYCAYVVQCFGFSLEPSTFDSVKKLLTLSLLALFLLNVLGYYGVFVGLQVKSGQAMRDRFDSENYSAEQQVTIKVPITIPYASDSREYERVDGEFEHQGQVYRLVKQKLQSDTLFIVCIKDHQAAKINQALADYVKTFTDKPISSKRGSTVSFQFSKDFLSNTTEVKSSASGWNALFSFIRVTDTYLFISQDCTSPPPRL